MNFDGLDTARVAAALAVNAALAMTALRAGAVSRSGAAAGTVYGLAVYLALDWRGYCVLATFVVAGSGFTRYGYGRKLGLGVAECRSGARTWRNATANCLVGAVCAQAAGLTGQEMWRVAFVGAFAAALADTTESELGVLLARRAYLPPRLRSVAPGTEGAVSPAGTAAGLAAALALAALAATLGLVTWPAAVPVALAAVAATAVESLVAAGRELNNDALNLLTTLAGAVLAVAVAG